MLCVNDNENNLMDVLDYVESFEVLTDGKKEKIFQNDERFNVLISKLKDLFVNSRLMPAFGVSIHDETLIALEHDQWLQINLKQETKKNGLPFNSLLFKLEEVQSFNLIRFHNQKYIGRCLCLDLDEEIDLNNLILF